jgi:hypothetical protein
LFENCCKADFIVHKAKGGRARLLVPPLLFFFRTAITKKGNQLNKKSKNRQKITYFFDILYFGVEKIQKIGYNI